jgi:hypothetical protein
MPSTQFDSTGGGRFEQHASPGNWPPPQQMQQTLAAQAGQIPSTAWANEQTSVPNNSGDNKTWALNGMDKAQDLWADGGLKHPEAPGLKDPNLGVQLPNPLIGQTPGAPMIQDYQQIQQLQLLQVISCKNLILTFPKLQTAALSQQNNMLNMALYNHQFPPSSMPSMPSMQSMPGFNQTNFGALSNPLNIASQLQNQQSLYGLNQNINPNSQLDPRLRLLPVCIMILRLILSD